MAAAAGLPRQAIPRTGTVPAVCYRGGMAVGFVGLKARDLEDVSRSQERCAQLLRRLARSPAPNISPSLLAVFARLASPSCGWLDGDVAIELFAETDAFGDITRVRVLVELGAGQRERVLPPFTVPFALEEITAAAERTPSLLGSLRLERVSSRCVLLVAASEAPTSRGFAISESCLVELPGVDVDVDVDVDDLSWDIPTLN